MLLARRHVPYHPGLCLLMACIEATNRLIDQIVYQLYGLTEEEIKIVAGGMNS